MKIPLTLEKRETVPLLDGKILLEKVDQKILKKLIENDSILNKVQFTDHDFYSNEFIKRTYENEKDQLKNYEKLIKYDKVFVRYDKVKGMNGYGRVFPQKSLGLFSLRKQIRGALSFDYYVDIDISNCHPMLLLSIVKSNDINCTYLSKYVNNREKYLNMVINEYNVNKDTAKDLFIRLLYFGSFKNWARDNNIELPAFSFILKFKEELKEIGNILVNHNPDLVNIIKSKINTSESKNKHKNIVGSVVSYILGEWEYRIIETLYSYCTDNKIINNDCVICADGLMINKNFYSPELLSKFNEIIKEKFGFDLVFVKKELNREILDLLEKQS